MVFLILKALEYRDLLAQAAQRIEACIGDQEGQGQQPDDDQGHERQRAAQDQLLR